MENQQLVNDKLDQVVALLQEISELKDKECSFVLVASAPAPDKGEDTKKLVTAVYGNHIDTLIAFAERQEAYDIEKAFNEGSRKTMREPYESGEAYDKRRKEANKNNPNAN